MWLFDDGFMKSDANVAGHLKTKVKQQIFWRFRQNQSTINIAVKVVLKVISVIIQTKIQALIH